MIEQGSLNWNILILERLKAITNFYDDHNKDANAYVGFINSVNSLYALLAGEIDNTFLKEFDTKRKELDKIFGRNTDFRLYDQNGIALDNTQRIILLRKKEYEIRLHYFKFLCLSKLIKRKEISIIR